MCDMIRTLVPFLLVFVFIPATSCFENGVVRPDDPYIYIGNNLTLTCNLTKYNEVYDSRYLSFSHRHDEVIPSVYITTESTRSIVLRYPITSPEDGGNYVCKLKLSGSRPEVIGTQNVKVEYEPLPVTEINCRVYNWENMTCTWDLGVKFIHPKDMDIKLYWTVGSPQNDCARQTITSCSWLEYDEPDSFRSDMLYILGVRIENKHPKPHLYYPQKTIVVRVDTSAIVEPAPVMVVASERNSSCVTLTWKHEKTKRDLIYRVDFKQVYDKHWQKKYVGGVEILTLCGLQPHTLYKFRVVCKPRLFGGKVAGFWSDPVIVPVRTDEDVPAKAPELSPGSYTETPFTNYNLKKVVLYWKPLSKEDTNGNITYYHIDYRNYDSVEWDQTRVKGDTQEQLTLVTSDSYTIRIRASTAKGISTVFSEILVPAKSEKPKIPEHIVEAHNTTRDTKVTITWEPLATWSTKYWRTLISYTVYWCKGSRIEKLCQDHINSAEVPITDTEYEIQVDKFEMYIFGVAVNALLPTGETISSGFKWNTCVYMKNTRPDIAPPKIRMSIYQPSSGLSVDWDKLLCEETHTFIQSYAVNICPAIKGYNCSGETSTFHVDKNTNSFAILDLVDGSRYKMWVNAKSEAGHGPNSDMIYSVFIDSRLNTAEIGGVVVGSLFIVIVFLFGLILCARRVIRTLNKRYFEPIPIEIPHSLPPLPPIPMPTHQNSLDSDSSEGIYEKILDGPSSPGSSSESTTGVEAPLISPKWKFSSIKHYIYGIKKDTHRHSNDSGRGSMSHSADTLLMRLHPSHLKTNKSFNQSESDSGIIVNGRGQVCTYTNANQSEKSIDKCNTNIFNFNEAGDMCGEVSPYSCVDIVDKMDANSEQFRELLDDDETERSKYQGSTLSLPPGFDKMSKFMSQPLDYRAHSDGNDLDFEHRRLSSMNETREVESSDICSVDCTQDSVFELEHEITDSFSSREPESSVSRSDGSQAPGMNSYLQFVDSKRMEPMEHASRLAWPCSCDCHKTTKIVGDGYVTEAVMIDHAGDKCECVRMNGSSVSGHYDDTLRKQAFLQDLGKNCVHPCSVYNLPPHFYSSMGKVAVDPATTTEL